MTSAPGVPPINARSSLALLLVGGILLGCGMAVQAQSVAQNEKPEGASKVFEEARKRIYQIRTLTVDGAAENSTGSGFLVGKDGLIATNWHVVSDKILEPERYRLEAMRTDGSHIPVSVVAIDSVNDLALLKAADETGRPFTIHPSPLVKGDKGFSLGNPSGIGFTVVEGTYNGVAAKSLSENFHFTAAINAGMSGGPALTTNGDVFGINVARRTDGNLISFLVPAMKLAALMARIRTTNSTSEALLGEARQGMIDGQEKVTADIIGSPPRMQPIGPFILPVESGSASRCGGTSRKEEDDGYNLEWVFCVADLSITAGGKHSVGVMWSEYRVVSNLGLDAFRFAARLSDQFNAEKDDGGDKKIVGYYKCRTSFVKLKGGTARVTLCKRPYKQLDGLLDAHLRLVTVDSSEVGLVGNLMLLGFTESNIKRLARWYLETIEWKR
ncbi:S1C family serine protease [Propionivibrio sp.]|uniref:S1C family serine protease n=1 Tax=Propionivibrio sp. TaxID=2212460 RepID=UPI003BF402B8